MAPERATSWGRGAVAVSALLAALCLAAPGAARAQTVSTATAAVDPLVLRLDEVPWERERHFFLTTVELAMLGVGVWGVDKLRGVDWVDVTPEIWWQNISGGWEYDGDSFQTNYVSHPYHGSLFFNAARSNGYDFWDSMVFNLSASILWEFFGETFRPAINDWVTTGLSGTNLGEVIHRISVLVTDNTATGSERVWREIAGTLINPVRGFTRLISGELTSVFPNPAEHEVTVFQPILQLGARTIDADGRPGVQKTIYQVLLETDLIYDDRGERSFEPPFSAFRFGASLALLNRSEEPVSKITRLSMEGVLFGWALRDEPEARHRLSLTLLYDFLNNPAYEFGETSISAVWERTFSLGSSVMLSATASARGILMGATPNDYFDAPEGRNYDFGHGFGLSARAALGIERGPVARLSYSTAWILTMSEPDGSNHLLQFVAADARYPFSSLLAAGAMIAVYWRESAYDDFANVSARNPMATIFFALSP